MTKGVSGRDGACKASNPLAVQNAVTIELASHVYRHRNVSVQMDCGSVLLQASFKINESFRIGFVRSSFIWPLSFI